MSCIDNEPVGYISAVDGDGTKYWLVHWSEIERRAWWSASQAHAMDGLIEDQIPPLKTMRHVIYIPSYRTSHRLQAGSESLVFIKMEFEQKVEKFAYSAALYLCDRAYGGPEEGGWYYDCGQLVDFAEAALLIPWGWEPIFFLAEEDYTPDKVIVEVSKRNEWLMKVVNVGRRDPSSVLSEGHYRFCIVEGAPANWPQEIPHYE